MEGHWKVVYLDQWLRRYIYFSSRVHCEFIALKWSLFFYKVGIIFKAERLRDFIYRLLVYGHMKVYLGFFPLSTGIDSSSKTNWNSSSLSEMIFFFFTLRRVRMRVRLAWYSLTHCERELYLYSRWKCVHFESNVPHNHSHICSVTKFWML